MDLGNRPLGKDMKPKEWRWILLLGLLAVIFWWPLLSPGMAPYIRDLSSEIIPKRGFWALSGGFALWDPYSFLGMPYAANPQSEAFYPGNLIFFLLRPERAIVFYILAHHILFLGTLFPALRRLGFSLPAAMIAAIGFGFGGYFISLTFLIVLLSTFAWLPLLIILLDHASDKKWLRPALLLGLVMAVQVLAGEVEVAAQSWVLAFIAAALSPKPRVLKRALPRMAGALIFGLGFGLLLSAPQVMLSREMVPLSNRGQGVPLAEALLWSLKPYALKSFLLPNFLLPVSANRPVLHWGLGFFSGYPYLLSIYLGGSLIAAALCAFLEPRKFRPWAWLLIGAAGIMIAMGETLPWYKLLHQCLPGFNLFRIPQKFILYPAFASAMLAATGVDELKRLSPGRFKLAAMVVLCGALAGAVLIAYPLKLSELGNRYEQVANYLMWRAVIRVSALALVTMGLALALSASNRRAALTLIGLVVFLDLWLAHRGLNLPIEKNFYGPNKHVRELRAIEKDRPVPVRILSLSPEVRELVMKRVMDPRAFFANSRDILSPFWAMHYKLNDVNATASFYPADVTIFRKAISSRPDTGRELVLARAGVEYVYRRDSGFSRVNRALPRAGVFYRAQFSPDLDRIIDAWTDANFPAETTVLLWGTGQSRPDPGLSRPTPARITGYENEQVTVEAEAKQDGWLLLLDAWYPGWEAEVDGKPAQILRANGFFRAVQIPAGRHVVIFKYHPGAFYKTLCVSLSGLVLWLGLLGLSFRKRTGQA